MNIYTTLGVYQAGIFGGGVGAIWLFASGHTLFALMLVVMAFVGLLGWGNHYQFEWSADYEAERVREARLNRTNRSS